MGGKGRVDENAQLLEKLQWIARADFYNETPRFGSVRHQYRKKFLTGVQLGPEVEYYFKKCVPTSTYEGNTRKCWCYFNSSPGLWFTGHDYNYSEILTRCGFLIIATDQGGNPLIVDPTDSTIHSFQCGYLQDDKLVTLRTPMEWVKVPASGYRQDDKLVTPRAPMEWVEVPATRESVREWSQFSWDSLYSFFDDVEQATREWHRNRLVPCIAKRELPDLVHYQSLGLGILPDQVDDDGRTPLEVARETGNTEVIEIVEAILRENP